MEQTPVHEHHNPDLLSLIPIDAQRIVEVGCSSGALAREFKKLNAHCHYIGVEIDPNYAQLARRYCDTVHLLDIELVEEAALERDLNGDCWVFGDALEHLRDPWRLLQRIRKVLPPQGSVVVCLPNAQHWYVQARLCTGQFRYEPSGLLDRTHLRWFTRQTIIEMFQEARFQIVTGFARVLTQPDNAELLPAIGQLAKLCGGDAETAKQDAMAFQYVIRAVPA